MDEPPGFTSEEIKRGEDQAWHIPKWGCLAVIVLIAVAAIVIWRV
jgi:hypothetical protein